jgi:hypothetical protein
MEDVVLLAMIRGFGQSCGGDSKTVISVRNKLSARRCYWKSLAIEWPETH